MWCCCEEGKRCVEAQVGNMDMEQARAGVATKAGWSVPSRLVWLQYHFHTSISIPTTDSEAQSTVQRTLMI
jgi:hypothetical protein